MKIECEKCNCKTEIEDSFLTTPTKDNPKEKRLCADCYAFDEYGVVL